MADFPISHETGKAVNRYDIDEYRWPMVSTEMKDGSKRIRHLTVRPIRSISFEYDAVTLAHASTLKSHYYAHGHSFAFNLRIPPRASTLATQAYHSTVSVRYVKFSERRFGQGVDPFRYPSFTIKFEEVV